MRLSFGKSSSNKRAGDVAQRNPRIFLPSLFFFASLNIKLSGFRGYETPFAYHTNRENLKDNINPSSDDSNARKKSYASRCITRKVVGLPKGLETPIRHHDPEKHCHNSVDDFDDLTSPIMCRKIETPQRNQFAYLRRGSILW